MIAAAAHAGGWSAARYDDEVGAYHHRSERIATSNWILLSRDPAALARVTADPPPLGKWRPLRADAGFAGWTDDYASVLPLVKAFR